MRDVFKPVKKYSARLYEHKTQRVLNRIKLLVVKNKLRYPKTFV